MNEEKEEVKTEETPSGENTAEITEKEEIKQEPMEKEEPAAEAEKASEEVTTEEAPSEEALTEPEEEKSPEEPVTEPVSEETKQEETPEEKPTEESPAEPEKEEVTETTVVSEEQPAEEEKQAETSPAEVPEETKEEETRVVKPIVTDSSYTAPLAVLTEEKANENINSSRLSFREKHQKILRNNRIVAIVFVALAVAAALGTYFYANLFLYLFIAILVLFAVTIIYARLSKNKLNKELAVYMEDYGINTNSYAFSQEGISDVHLAFKEKMDKDELLKLDFKENVFFVNSRNMVKGKMESIDFSCVDVAYRTGEEKVKKSQKTVFVGKVLSFDVSVKDRGRILLYLAGCGDAAPDKLMDVNEVNVSGLKNEWKVYSSMNNYKAVFTSEIVKALNDISTNETMNDVVISIGKDHFLVGLSYCDEFMVIPLEKEYDRNALNQYKEDLGKVVNLMKGVLSNSHFRK